MFQFKIPHCINKDKVFNMNENRQPMEANTELDDVRC